MHRANRHLLKRCHHFGRIAAGASVEVAIVDTSGGEITPFTNLAYMPYVRDERFTPLAGSITPFPEILTPAGPEMSVPAMRRREIDVCPAVPWIRLH
jgi:hypothetical protein